MYGLETSTDYQREKVISTAKSVDLIELIIMVKFAKPTYIYC